MPTNAKSCRPPRSPGQQGRPPVSRNETYPTVWFEPRLAAFVAVIRDESFSQIEPIAVERHRFCEIDWIGDGNGVVQTLFLYAEPNWQEHELPQEEVKEERIGRNLYRIRSSKGNTHEQTTHDTGQVDIKGRR